MRRPQPSPTPPRPICCSCYAGACTSPPAARVWDLKLPYIPFGRGVARACMRRRVAAYSCAGMALLWVSGLWAWHGMAVVTRGSC